MNRPWIANKGQLVQIVCATVSALVAVIALYFVLKTNNSLPRAWTVFAISGAVLLLFVGIFIGHHSKTTAKTESTIPLLTVQDLYVEYSESATYKLKLRIVLKNESGQDVTAEAPSWISESGDISAQPPKKLLLQLEGDRGWASDRWPREEVYELHLHHGQVFRTWIGLPSSPGDIEARRIEARRRHEIKCLGILAVPLKVSGRSAVEKIRL